jgi:hypothetical protein
VRGSDSQYSITARPSSTVPSASLPALGSCIYRQATDSNPRGLDARAFAEETGALENCAWNTS